MDTSRIRVADPERVRLDLLPVTPGIEIGVDNLERFEWLLVTDPLTAILDDMYWSFRELRDLEERSETSFSRKFPSSRPKIEVSTRNLLRAINSCKFERGSEQSVGLEKLLGSQAEMISLHDVARSTFEDTRFKLAAEDEKRRFLLDEAQVSFDALLSGMSEMTQEHVALQAHLEYFVIVGMPDSDEIVKLANTLYAPLFRLRDEYFEAPRCGLLQEYLETAEQISKSLTYKSFIPGAEAARQAMRPAKDTSPDGMLAKLEEREITLEVMTWLEVAA